MIRLSLLALPVAFSLAACSSSYWPDTYTWPTGYVHHDITPIATPHGYDKTITEETQMKSDIDANASAWRDGLGRILLPIHAAFDRNTPVAVVMDPGLTPLNASAANYLRDMLIDMDYLVALPDETPQILKAQTVPTDRADEVYVVLAVHRGENLITWQDGVMDIPNQIVEAPRLPGFSATPASGPAAIARPDHVLNQD